MNTSHEPTTAAFERFGVTLDGIAAWVRDVAGEPTEPRILNDKGWSLVAHFGSAVFKVTAAGVFSDGPHMFELVGQAAPGLVPDLLAWRTSNDGSHQILFRPFKGQAVDSLPIEERKDGLVQMARILASIQTNVGKALPTGLKTIKATGIPRMLDELLGEAVPRCQSDFPESWAANCAKQEVPDDLAAHLYPYRSRIADWAQQLDETVSLSIDHVDFLPHNANLLTNGQVLIYDWEQATLGIPHFSIDILLAYAQCLDEGLANLDLRPERPTPTQSRIHEAYQPSALALSLSPIRYGHLEWTQAESTGVPHYGVDDLAWWLTRALRRWERIYRAAV